MSISIELLQKYPWLPYLETFYSELSNKDPFEFVSDLFKKNTNGEIERRVTELFVAAFNNLEEIKDYKSDYVNISLYLILKIIIFSLDNKPISNRLANLYSKHAYKDLIEDHDDANLYDVCKDLDLDIKYYPLPVNYGYNISKEQRENLTANFSIHYIDYLKLAANLRDEYRKLIHNALSEGYVFLQRKSLIRLIQEFVRRKLNIDSPENENVLEDFRNKIFQIKEFKELFDNILHEWELKKGDFEYSFEVAFNEGSDLSPNFPPCIQEILLRIEEGQNLIHIERLFLVFFLHALDYPLELIIDLFAKLPDFDRKKTEYQVKFAKQKGYSPHSCETLKSLNLCMAEKYNDKVCKEGYFSKKSDGMKKLNHPLFYVQLKQYRSSRNNSNNKKPNQENE